jgi:hypothetical protein
MGYVYEIEKPHIFTEEGQRKFLIVRDNVKTLLQRAGAVRMQEAIRGVSGDSWQHLAYVDRLVELGELRELNFGPCAGQHRVFVAGNGK